MGWQIGLSLCQDANKATNSNSAQIQIHLRTWFTDCDASGPQARQPEPGLANIDAKKAKNFAHVLNGTTAISGPQV